jgi:hypothetical protein
MAKPNVLQHIASEHSKRMPILPRKPRAQSDGPKIGGTAERAMSSAYRMGVFWMGQVLALSIAATCLASDEPPKSAIKLLRKKIILTAPVGLNPLADVSRPVARIDINTATLQELMQLSGITLPIANHLIADRPYRATMDLVARNIIEKTDYDKIGMQLTASTRRQPED